MSEQVTLNGNTYSDDGTVGKGMADGAFRENLVPMLSDCIVDISGIKDDAQYQADLAQNAATAAAVAAATVVTGPGSNGSSTTSLTIALGVQSLVIQTGKTIPLGAPVMIASTASPDNWMHGTAVSYTSGTGALQVNVKNIGLVTPGVYPTLAAWTVSLSGPAGITGLLNELKGASVASAATVNLDAVTGNLVHLTGSVTVTAFTLAQGSARTVIVDAAPLLTNGANLVLPGSENIQAGAGDTFTIRGDGGGKSVVVHYTRGARTPPTGAFRNAEVLTSSQVWTAKVSGIHRLTLVGASASGAAAWSVVSGGLTASAAAASGGSAGAIAIKYFNAVAGDSYVLSLGAAGASVTCTAAPGNAVQGNDAGDSTFIGPGVSVTAGGGKKGAAAIASSGTAVALGAAGGSASGGDFNFTGGGSGTSTATADAAGNAAASGGGVAPYKGFGYGSGAATANRAGAAAAASGGAGAGGASGTASATTANASSGAGGCGGPSPNATNTTSAGGAGTPAAFASILVTSPLSLSGVGGNGNQTTPGSSGAGSGGNVSANTGAVAFLAGSGGAARLVSSSGTTVTSGSVALGGASGGVAVAANTNAAGVATSGDGGAAFAIIETT